MKLVTIDDIRAAAERIRARVVRTPLLAARWGDDERPLWVKPENLQPIGAFKVRGAFNAIAVAAEAASGARPTWSPTRAATTPRPSPTPPPRTDFRPTS